MTRPYTRSLDLQDYDHLEHVPALLKFEKQMTVAHCGWHAHKIWENASIMQQLDELHVPNDAQLIDVGSGGAFFPCYLAAEAGYRNVTLTDSMLNRDISSEVAEQRRAYSIDLPLHALAAEDMSPLPSESYDVVMCISVIEHVRAEHHDHALQELWRLTKPGGYIFITSDYFRSANGMVDANQYNASPWRPWQHTAYHEQLVLDIPNRVDAEFVGETDLEYRGDFVHNYSFVNICLRKPNV